MANDSVTGMPVGIEGVESADFIAQVTTSRPRAGACRAAAPPTAAAHHHKRRAERYTERRVPSACMQEPKLRALRELHEERGGTLLSFFRLQDEDSQQNMSSAILGALFRNLMFHQARPPRLNLAFSIAS